MEIVEASVPVNPLRKFFSVLGYKLITVSLQPEKEGAQLQRSKWFSPKNRVRAIPLEEFFSDEVQLNLQEANAAGFAVYFTINEGDGSPADVANGNLNCGRGENIQILRTLVIDTDGADDSLLRGMLKLNKLAPHFINESSPGKYHYYFVIKPVPNNESTKLQWQSLQRLLDDLIPGLDQTMLESNQVLRIPGFFNNKPTLEKAFKVRIAGELENVAPYDLAGLYHGLQAHKYDKIKETNGHNGTNGHHAVEYSKFEFPKEKLVEGERRNKICSYIEHIMENILPLEASIEDYFTLVDAFIITNLKPEHQADYLEGGRVRQNLLNYFRDQNNRRVRIQQAKEAERINQNWEHTDNIQDKNLPDDFYIRFPGDLGMLVREIHNYAPNLSMELCFSGALMISGALKSETFRFNGAWPYVNGLVIVGTGGGKSTLKDIVERTLESCGLRGKYPQVFGFQNSVQSLHTALYTAGGSGTTIIDESGDYLQNITSKQAPAYAKALKKYFKEATTGKDKGTWLHPGGSLSYQVPAINGGMLSLWMLIQPDRFMGQLSLEDMADGFLPRFFIFNGKTNIKLTRFMTHDSENTSFEPSLDLKVYLESLVHLMPALAVETTIEEAEKCLKESTPKAKSDVIAAAKRDAVYVARSEARKMNNLKVKITEEAQAHVVQYLEEKEKEALVSFGKNGESDPSLGIFVRMEEMLMRLLCNAVSYSHMSKSAIIDLELAAACVRFHRFQTDRFFSNELAEISKGSGEREEEIVLKALIKAHKGKSNQPVTSGEVAAVIRSTKRPKNITNILFQLVNSGTVEMQKRPSKAGGANKIPYYLPIKKEDYEL